MVGTVGVLTAEPEEAAAELEEAAPAVLEVAVDWANARPAMESARAKLRVSFI